MPEKKNNAKEATVVETVGSQNAEVVETTTASAAEVAAETQPTALVPEVKDETVVSDVIGEILPPVATVDTVERKTPPDQRRYTLLKRPSIAPKGNQRRIILHVILERIAAGKTQEERIALNNFSAEDLVARCNYFGYSADAGTLLSVRWHLHQMKIDGYTKVINPTYMEVAKPTVPVANGVTVQPTLAELKAQIEALQAQIAAATTTAQ